MKRPGDFQYSPGIVTWLATLALGTSAIGALYPPAGLIAGWFGLFLAGVVLVKFQFRIGRRIRWRDDISALPQGTRGEWLAGVSGIALAIGMFGSIVLLLAFAG